MVGAPSESASIKRRFGMSLCWTQRDPVKDRKREVENDPSSVSARPGDRVPYGHDVVSASVVTIIRQTVKAVAGKIRNISVNAAGGIEGLNGTLPRRVTAKRPRVRRYSHFDDPLTDEELRIFTVTPKEVINHPFFPLLGYKKISRRMDFDVFPPLAKHKERDIKYAAHKDSAIYSFYAETLSARYEQFLINQSFGSSILAYRGGIGYNVPFAKSLFDEIKRRSECHAICLDVSGFFDNLRHDVIKRNLELLLDNAPLPDDWYRIFRRLTSFEYVMRDELSGKIGKLKKGRICEIDTFRRAVRPLIKKNLNKYGIPQGTPLSGLVSNIYMIEFDRAAAIYLKSMNGSYRRYSDDIAIVIPNVASAEEVLRYFNALSNEFGLTLNLSKTTQTTFNLPNFTQQYSGDLLQYPGFTYDGSRVLIRSQSVKNFYSRMKTNIRRYVRASAKKNIPLDQLRKRVLVGRFTHWGDSRNFIQYAYRASDELDAPEIRRQLRNHVPIFDRQWAKLVVKYDA
jgi:RNA-directed DNA polymerase